jgi:hypothetical protein
MKRIMFSESLKTNDTFRYKTTEVKRKLTKGLLSQREKISKQIGPKPNEITIINRYRNIWFKDVWNVTSELLFAAICGESGFGITFDPPTIDHDYDFIVNGYPVQVKSSNKSYSSFSAATDAKKKRKGDVDDNRIKYDLVINKVLDTIHDNTKFDR